MVITPEEMQPDSQPIFHSKKAIVWSLALLGRLTAGLAAEADASPTMPRTVFHCNAEVLY